MHTTTYENAEVIDSFVGSTGAEIEIRNLAFEGRDFALYGKALGTEIEGTIGVSYTPTYVLYGGEYDGRHSYCYKLFDRKSGKTYTMPRKFAGEVADMMGMDFRL